jgi:8-oxo-dGTP pyrophosphatase MutT (NUDIX family)
MYKVFIENKPIIFIENKPSVSKSYSVDAKMLDSIDEHLIPIIKKLPANKKLYVLCDHVKEDMDRLFESYDKVMAAGGIVKRKKRLLFIKRNGFWDIPKGKLDEGETPEDGAMREIEEECGIKDLELIYPIIETYHTYEYKGKPTLKRTFWYAFDYQGTKEVQGQLEEGITEVRWFKKSELTKIRKNTFRSILEVLNAYLVKNQF